MLCMLCMLCMAGYGRGGNNSKKSDKISNQNYTQAQGCKMVWLCTLSTVIVRGSISEFSIFYHAFQFIVTLSPQFKKFEKWFWNFLIIFPIIILNSCRFWVNFNFFLSDLFTHPNLSWPHQFMIFQKFSSPSQLKFFPCYYGRQSIFVYGCVWGCVAYCFCVHILFLLDLIFRRIFNYTQC